jgi:sugar lactone lactonase YvrE
MDFIHEGGIFMSERFGGRVALAIGLLACSSLFAPIASAQNHAPNPYKTIEGWAKLPDGRKWGATSAVYAAPDGKHIWVAERCGANLCVESDDDPVLLFDADGELVRSFGAGLIAWPHGIFVDSDGNVWIADAVGYAPVPEGWGHVVYKFSEEGELLMTLGKKGVAGAGTDAFNKPSAVLVAPNGDIFVADGHDAGGNNRIVKFGKDGTFIKEWGSAGQADGQFIDPHALAMDSAGRLFVGDRGNSRIQIFDQDGNHLATWTQFGRPSGLFIDANDVLYSADSESNAARNPGWKRGIRIGSAKDGFVDAFIPDPEPDQDNSGTSGAEGVAADSAGNVYGAEVGPQAIKKYVRK